MVFPNNRRPEGAFLTADLLAPASLGLALSIHPSHTHEHCRGESNACQGQNKAPDKGGGAFLGLLAE